MANAPSPRAQGSWRPSRPVRLTLLLVLLVTGLLELWRPLYYLTDDNLTGFMPVATQACRALWHGRWEFELRDPSFFNLFGPFIFLFSWITLTPFWLWLVDLVSLANSLVIGGAFCWSAAWLCRRFEVEVPDWLLVFLSVAYTFTPFNLMIGSSWLGFLNCQASFPLLLVGLLHPSAGRSFALLFSALLFTLFGGHNHTLVILCLFTGILAIGASLQLRRAAVAGRFALAMVATVLVALLVALPALRVFATSTRAAGLTIEQASLSRFDLVPLLLSYLLGPLSRFYSPDGLLIHSGNTVYNLSLAFSAANLLVLLLLFTGAPRTRAPWVRGALLLAFAVATLGILRPDWLAVLLSQIPVLKSLQWPFRELWLLQATGSLAALLGLGKPRPRAQFAAAAAGILVQALLVLLPPPTFWEFPLDRTLLLNGAAERYWAGLLAGQTKPPHIITGVRKNHRYNWRHGVPFVVLGTFNYGMLFGYEPRYGYTFVTSLDSKDEESRPYDFAGTYEVSAARRMAAADPSLWLMELVEVRPVHWLLTAGGKTRHFVLDTEMEVMEVEPPAPGSPAPESTGR